MEIVVSVTGHLSAMMPLDVALPLSPSAHGGPGCVGPCLGGQVCLF